ncbi:hypothetical protein AN639_08545 [Candidatus Epulonipiscium fishelsonii]|uniref:Uncharacterized protein n=1 Tax=Candidatus Epulonipiscium fishelsonii TaxID=77094 RepID=A0ACC8X9D5_9FIRM|nr:hypothetical protein AN639_08545 [Epulopiscium sp. SCG-B05WGA-EpuloA1]ONI38785.1 hypothetical protein AN396_09880 [Epulopiscium sp. SCG-B11WGA-EpuloA1]
MNETLKNIKSRKTCRRYISDKQITEEELNLVLEAGMYAPSGFGKQSPIFIVIQDKEIIKELSKINTSIWKKGPDGFFGAPTVIVLLSSPEIIHTYQKDCMAAVENMLIAAESLGLGSACISRAQYEFESEYGKELLKKLGIDESYVAVEHVILGYRDGEKVLPTKRNENRIFRI